ncbi:MAG: PilZ domain-containing protein [Candidatus Eremiobacteraeota bacterium]|nr:PilZ domain-containing protein [Candidatus Eremiobacteraeota bacterium]
MLSDLLGWFTGKEANRRKYTRKRKPYRATVSVDAGITQKPAIGLDISGTGLCILTQAPVGRDEFEVRATLDNRMIRVRAKAIWQDTVTYQGKSVWRYGMRFTGVAADDWDAVIRYTSDQAVVEGNKAQEQLTTVRMTPDDANRLLPTRLQQRLLRMLVERRRLAPIKDNVTPLVQYFYSGVVRHDGKVMHRVTVQSKIMGDERGELHETRFVFDDKGESISMLN